jgi:hypothetical protein
MPQKIDMEKLKPRAAAAPAAPAAPDAATDALAAVATAAAALTAEGPAAPAGAAEGASAESSALTGAGKADVVVLTEQRSGIEAQERDQHEESQVKEALQSHFD